MGDRGPAKRPTNLAVLHGDKSRDPANEPQPGEGPLVPPDLDEEVRAVWDYTVEQLKAMGLATPADRDVLVCYCEAVVAHRKASAALARSGLLIRSAAKPGLYLRNPLIAVQRDQAALVRVLAREFGLTPSARSDLSTGGKNNGASSGPERLLS